MSTLRKLPRQTWGTYFNTLSEAVAGTGAGIEVASMDFGDQRVVEWLPLLGITYDAHDDLIDVSLPGLNHLIRQPKEVQITESPLGVRGLAVICDDGSIQVLTLKTPLQLPPPSMS